MDSLRKSLICFIAGICFVGSVFCAETPAVAEVRQADDLPATEAEVSPPVDIWDRIRRGYAMPKLNNSRVKTSLRSYSRNPRHIERVFERAGKYLYHIVDEIEQRGLPTELALLPFVESAFQPEALSHAKASGLWQFMPQTGNIYSLQQNFWKDERRDVLQSTRAALDYLEKLYQQFGDWHLALAAYNLGQGSIRRAIAANEKKGLPTDYLSLNLPQETRRYVPKLLAIKKLIDKPEDYGLKLPEIANEPYFVKVNKDRDLDLETAAQLAETDITELRLLNPSYSRPVIVAAHEGSILIPADKADAFVSNLINWQATGKPLSNWDTYKVKKGDTLAKVAKRFNMTEDELRAANKIPPKRSVIVGSTLLVKNPDSGDIAISEKDSSMRLTPLPTTRRITYRVRSGDTISGIAKRFGVKASAIRRDNRLKSDRLKIGQRLRLTIHEVERTRIIKTVYR